MCQLGNSMTSNRHRMPAKIAPAPTRPLRSSQVASRKNPPDRTAKELPQGSFPSPMMTALPNSATASVPARAVRTANLRPFVVYLRWNLR